MDKQDKEVTNMMEQKVDNAIHSMREHLRRKLQIFEEAAKKAGSFDAEKGGGGGNGASATVRLPDLTSDKKAVIELASPKKILGTTGGTQQEMIGGLAKRVEKLIRDDANVPDGSELPSEPASEPGTLGRLAEQLNQVKAHLERGASSTMEPSP